jgi:hypothetical protein
MLNITPSLSDRVGGIVPRYFLDEYPLFVKFFEYYFQWKNRNGEFNNNDLAFFSALLGITADEYDGAIELIRLSNTKSPWQHQSSLAEEYLLERTENVAETSLEEIFLTADDEILEPPVLNSELVTNAIAEKGGFYTSNVLGTNEMDLILCERLISHVASVKGTKTATNLFFLMFFGENLTDNVAEGAEYIWYPKTQTISIDHDLDIDGTASMRDDAFYNEFTYVINTKHNREFYEPLFSNIYMKYIHPSGFGVFIEPTTTTP